MQIPQVPINKTARVELELVKNLENQDYLSQDDSMVLLDLKPEASPDRVRGLLSQLLPKKYVLDEATILRREDLLEDIRRVQGSLDGS